MCGNLLSSTYHLNSTQSSLFWHVLMYWATFMKIDDDWIKSNLSFSKPHDHSMGGMLKLISRDNIRMLFDQSNHHETRTRTKTTKSPLMTLQERVLKQSVSSVHLTWLIDLICWLIDLTDLIWLTTGHVYSSDFRCYALEGRIVLVLHCLILLLLLLSLINCSLKQPCNAGWCFRKRWHLWELVWPNIHRY